jgi:hypothetical protein
LTRVHALETSLEVSRCGDLTGKGLDRFGLPVTEILPDREGRVASVTVVRVAPP